MTTDKELEARFWKALDADRVMMLGLTGEDVHLRPMSAQLEGSRGPIWFFTSTDSAIVQSLGERSRAVATFAAKGFEVFATLHGEIRLQNDRAIIDKLWDRFIAAWYKDGKEDPTLALLRFDPEHAEIWENEASLITGFKVLLGTDLKKDTQSKVAEVRLR